MRLAAVPLALALLLAAPASSPAAGADAPPARVAIAGGDLTEIAFALGAADRVVAVDSTSTSPEAAAELPQMGYLRRLAPEGVLSARPDLLIAAPDAGPASAMAKLEAAAVEIALSPEADTPEAVPEKIAFMGRVLDLEAEADALAARYRRELAAARDEVAALGAGPRALFVLAIEGGGPLVAGRGTSAHAILTAAGAENAAADLTGWRPMSREAVLAAQPEAVVMMDGHAERSGGLQAVLARPDFAATPAGRDGRGVTLDGSLLLGFGPRTPEAIRALARALRPEAAAR